MSKLLWSLLIVFLSVEYTFGLPNDGNNNDFKCDPNNNVQHFFPDPKNCAKYWECWNGVGTHHTCNSSK